MWKEFILAGYLVIGVHLNNSAAVSFITKCKSDDSKCAKLSAQAAIPMLAKGIPEMGIKPLDPLFYDNLDTSSNDLKLILKDITVTGLKNCVAKRIQRDPANQKLFVKMLCTVKLDGQYEMDGRLLVLPIQGKGDAHVILRKLIIDVDADIVEKVGKDGLNHWHIKSWKHSYELKDKADLDLQNLFGGNEVLGRAAHDLLQSSANDVVAEVGPPIIKALVTRVVKTVDSFFGKVPADELSLD